MDAFQYIFAAGGMICVLLWLFSVVTNDLETGYAHDPYRDRDV